MTSRFSQGKNSSSARSQSPFLARVFRSRYQRGQHVCEVLEFTLQRASVVLWLIPLQIAFSGTMATPLIAGEPLVISGPIMGTRYTIKVWPEHFERLDDLNRKIESRLHQIDQRMSTYKNESEVSRFNRAPAGNWFSVSDETAGLVERALEASQLTGGAFDVTVGPLVRLWHFGPSSHADASLPTDEEIAETLRFVGYDKLAVRVDPPSLRKTMDQVEIDLSAIAKGYAVDQVAQVLANNEVRNYLVEIGGEIRCAGNRSPDESWTVGIEDPRSDSRNATTFLFVSDASVASSGDYRNFYEVDGVRYSHTIDPRSGRPVQHQFAASTVWDDNCANADAHATALLVMGDSALDWCEQNGIRALLFERQAGTFVMHRSSSFPERFVDMPRRERDNPQSSFWRLAIASAIVFGVALAAMAVGVILSNRCIKGSCGGMAGLTDEHGRPLCEGCTKPSTECIADPSVPKQENAHM